MKGLYSAFPLPLSPPNRKPPFPGGLPPAAPETPPRHEFRAMNTAVVVEGGADGLKGWFERVEGTPQAYPRVPPTHAPEGPRPHQASAPVLSIPTRASPPPPDSFGPVGQSG